MLLRQALSSGCNPKRQGKKDHDSDICNLNAEIEQIGSQALTPRSAPKPFAVRLLPAVGLPSSSFKMSTSIREATVRRSLVAAL